MSGSNGIPKFVQCNREDEFVIKTRTANYGQTDFVTLTTTIPADQTIFSPLLINGSSASSITGPTGTQLMALMAQNYLITPGSYFQTLVHNSDSVSHTITIAGVGSVTVPANSYYELGFVVNSAGTGLNFYQPTTSNTGTGGDPLPALGNGYVVKTGPGSYQNNSFAGTNGITITNPDGTTSSTTTIGLNAAAITGIQASNVVVSPTVAGASNVQTALSTIAASVPSIPNGVGYVTENNGVYSIKQLNAGNNIAITNPAATPSNSVIAFSPAGVSQAVTGPGFSFDFPNVARPLYTTVDDMLASHAGLYVTSTTLQTTYPTEMAWVPALQSNNIFAGTRGTAQTYDTNGRCFQSFLGGWGAPTGSAKLQNWHFNNETNSIGYINGGFLNSLHSVGYINSGIQGNISAYVGARAYSYVVTTAAGLGTARNYNTALSTSTTPFYEIFSVDCAGNVNGQNFSGQNFSGQAFNVVSTKAEKKNVSSALHYLGKSATELIDTLEPIAYHYLGEEDSAQKRLGLIVEEVAEAGLDFLLHKEEGEDKPTRLKIDQLPFLLLQAFKELRGELEEVKEELAKFKKQ